MSQIGAAPVGQDARVFSWLAKRGLPNCGSLAFDTIHSHVHTQGAIGLRLRCDSLLSPLLVPGQVVCWVSLPLSELSSSLPSLLLPLSVPGQVAGQKNKSISAMKEERLALLHQYQRICHECSRLRHFVRLMDYMVSVADALERQCEWGRKTGLDILKDQGEER